ncbi:hypothetical protein UA75_18240 [Actinoalloteichus sp. GBA129-24]|nr:hypothetical protein UA75_18240 [Actinoalloteichus sp. GBA129-24]
MTRVSRQRAQLLRRRLRQVGTEVPGAGVGDRAAEEGACCAGGEGEGGTTSGAAAGGRVLGAAGFDGAVPAAGADGSAGRVAGDGSARRGDGRTGSVRMSENGEWCSREADIRGHSFPDEWRMIRPHHRDSACSGVGRRRSQAAREWRSAGTSNAGGSAIRIRRQAGLSWRGASHGSTRVPGSRRRWRPRGDRSSRYGTGGPSPPVRSRRAVGASRVSTRRTPLSRGDIENSGRTSGRHG